MKPLSSRMSQTAWPPVEIRASLQHHPAHRPRSQYLRPVEPTSPPTQRKVTGQLGRNLAPGPPGSCGPCPKPCIKDNDSCHLLCHHLGAKRLARTGLPSLNCHSTPRCRIGPTPGQEPSWGAAPNPRVPGPGFSPLPCHGTPGSSLRTWFLN